MWSKGVVKRCGVGVDKTGCMGVVKVKRCGQNQGVWSNCRCVGVVKGVVKRCKVKIVCMCQSQMCNELGIMGCGQKVQK